MARQYEGQDQINLLQTDLVGFTTCNVRVSSQTTTPT